MTSRYSLLLLLLFSLTSGLVPVFSLDVELCLAPCVLLHIYLLLLLSFSRISGFVPVFSLDAELCQTSILFTEYLGLNRSYRYPG